MPSINHQIPFRQPATTAPLNWSFARAHPATTLTNSVPQHQHQSMSLNPLNLSNPIRRDPTLPPLSNSNSRKRSASDDFNQPDHLLPSNHLRNPISGLPKRSKRSSPSNVPSENEDEKDLGTALVSLTKNELITLFHGLVQAKPELKSTIKNLLPPPSIDSVIARLEEVEKSLLDSIPNKRLNREEYIWNRVRIPLNSYVNECMTWLDLSAKSIETKSCLQNGQVVLSDVYVTISDQLSFLSSLSLSISKVESLLPNLSAQPRSTHEHPLDDHDLNWNVSYPLRSVLIPSLFQNWKSFIESIHKLIFVDRLIISESLIRKWFNVLDELCSSYHHHPASHPFSFEQASAATTEENSNQATQRLMLAVRDEAQTRFGCLVGLKR